MFPARPFWLVVWCLLVAWTPGAARARETGPAPFPGPPEFFVAVVTTLSTPPSWRHAAMEAASKRLKDPWSAHYRWERPQGSLFCGLVNAKNSYGGYSGWEPFYVIDFEGNTVASLYTWRSIPDFLFTATHPFTAETKSDLWDYEVRAELLRRCGFAKQ